MADQGRRHGKEPRIKEDTRGRWWPPVIIMLLTVMVYGPSLENGFVNWDDTEYIVANDDLKETTVYKHFTERPEVMGNYHPITMLSLAWSHGQAWNERKSTLDPRVFHTTDLLLHILGALLVYLVILQLSANTWIAACVALLFAVHPMHVESVAWASARKDVLHAAFWFAALACYIAHVRSKGPWWMIASLLLFAAALLSKAMAVSLVPVLFLVDWYTRRGWNRRVLAEKLPFVALAVWAGLKAIDAQRAFESIQDLDMYPLWQRLLFASFGLCNYVLKFFAPFGLSAFHGYPPPASEPAWTYWFALAGVCMLAAITWQVRRDRTFLFGMGFFIATVALVLQLFPVGGAVMAERYTYIPYVGLAFAVVGALWQRTLGSPAWRRALKIALCVFMIPMALLARDRSLVWKDGVTLWTDAISKDDQAPKSMNNYGVALSAAGRPAEALKAFDRTLQLKADYGDAFYNRGIALFALHRYEEAIVDYTRAIHFRPTLAVAWHNRAGTYYTMGRPYDALPDALKALELGYPVDPQFIEVLRQQTGNRSAQ